MSKTSEPGRSVGRSLLCNAGHELRVTRRCVIEDLGCEPDATFAELLAYEIVQAFCAERHNKLHGTNTVGPAAGAKTATVLRRGNDHRGATWYDESEGVVWLCGYARHRSGEPDDAFPYLQSLIAADRLLPDEDDDVALIEDRAERFALVVEPQSQALLAEARNDPGVEKRAMIGTTQPVSLLVYIVETLEETFVALTGTSDVAQIQVLLVALYPTRAFDDWEYADALPTRSLDLAAGEFCLSILHELQSEAGP